MSPHRIACLILGGWLAGCLLMAWVAMESFHSVDRAMQDPAALSSAQFQKLGHAGVRQLLRHQVGEQNRFLFEHWEQAQLLIGIAIFGLLLFGTHVGKVELGLPLLMMLLVAVAHWLITPQIIALGRTLDFLPSLAPAHEETRLRAMHSAYTAIEVMKLLVGTVLAGLLSWRGSRRGTRIRKHVDPVDHANHGHINR